MSLGLLDTLRDIDVIVVGGGTAGLPTAVSCCEQGLRVLLLEKADRLGGTLWYTGASFSAAGSRLQKAAGVEDSWQEHLADANVIGHGLADQGLLRRAVEEAGATVDWLEDLGVVFYDSPALGPEHELYSKARTHYQGERREEGTGVPFLAAMRNALKRHAAAGRCTVLREARVTALTTAADGRVDGVRLADRGGQEHTVQARAVVLTTGGFGSNPALMDRLGAEHPDIVSMTAPTSTGDGLEMALALDAATSHLEYFNPGLGAFEDPHAPGRGLLWMNLTANRPPALTGDIWLDRDGRRWVREDHPSNDHKEKALASLPGLLFWVVFDQAGLDATPPAGRAWLAELELRDAAGFNCRRADDVAGLAAAIGADPAVLQSTIDAYNDGATQADDALGRQALRPLGPGPWYALRARAFILSTRGGIRIDDRMRVLRRDGSEIDGLYAVGEVTGFGRLSGDAQVGGMGVGPCFTLGRALGRDLAQRLNGSVT